MCVACAGISDICLKQVFTHMLQDGQGPLHVAADLGNTKVVRTLMQLGADKDSRDKVRHSPCRPRPPTPLDLASLIDVVCAPSPSAWSGILLWCLKLGGGVAAARPQQQKLGAATLASAHPTDNETHYHRHMTRPVYPAPCKPGIRP